MIRFVLLFTLFLIGLFVLELLPVGQDWVVVPFTKAIAQISAWLIQQIDQEVTSYGVVLQDKVSGLISISGNR